MLQHPNFDPIAIQLGPVAIHWYGLMYLIGFSLVWLLGRYRIRHGYIDITLRDLEDLIFYSVIGVIIGGRLGYVFFYKPAQYMTDPIGIFKLWEGGMAFHGGLIGVVVAIFWFSIVRKKHLLSMADFLVPLVPLGLAAGRFGNFINGELWGRASDLPWAMVFSHAGDNIARHPSQLYEMILEGFVLFIILWVFSKKPRPMGQVSGLFLMAYGVFRFLVEFTREPDDFLGLLTANLSMGQWLSIPMIVIGAVLFVHVANRPVRKPND